MTTAVRLSIVLAVLFLCAAAVATFAPAEYRGSDCQTWINPGWDEDRVTSTQKTIEVTAQTQQLTGSALPDGLVMDAYQRADDTLAACTSKLGVRRYASLIFIVLAVASIPTARFIGGGGSRRKVESATI